MNPSVDDRLASIVRALSDIILPALPNEASLAREQCQLAMGHLQILRVQLPKAAEFAEEEMADARILADAVLAAGEGGPAVSASLDALRSVRDGCDGPATIRRAIHDVIRSSSVDGSAAFRARLLRDLLPLEEDRAAKERRWFAAMGFDQEADA